MARKKELTLQEKNEIVKKLAQGWSTLEISKKIGRDNRTVKKIAEVGIQPRKRRHQREFRNLNARDLSRLKRQMIKTPNLSSKSIFEACGLENVGRTTRCKVLKKFATVKSRHIGQFLSKKHKEARLAWAKKVSQDGLQQCYIHRRKPGDTWWARWLDQRMGGQWKAECIPFTTTTRGWWSDDMGRNYW